MSLRRALNGLHLRSILVLLLAVTPPFALLSSVASDWKAHEYAEADAAARQVAQQVVDMHARLVGETEDVLRRLAQTVGTPGDSRQDIPGLIEHVSSVRFVRVDVGAAWLDGRVANLIGAAGGLAAFERSSNPGPALETRPLAVGRYDRDETTGGGRLTVAYPGRDGSGTLTRILFAVLDTGWLRELASNVALPEGTTVSILDGRGAVLMQEPPSEEPAGRHGLGSLEFSKLVHTNDEVTADEVVADAILEDGRRSRFVVRPLQAGAGGLFVAVAMPHGAATALIDASLVKLTRGFILALGLAIGLASVGIGLTLVRPLRRVASTIARFSDGDRQARTSLRHAPEELNELAASFDRMAETLQQREREVGLKNELIAFQERRCRALIENSSDGIVLVGSDNGVMYASSSTERILGYVPAELVGRSVLDHIHPDDREVLLIHLARLHAAPAGISSSRFRIRHKDGGWRWIESVGTNLLADPAVGAIVGNFRDVTYRVEAEGALRLAHDELEQRVAERTSELVEANAALKAEVGRRVVVEEELRKHALALHQASDAVFLTDRDGNIEYVNPAFERMTGYAREDAIGQTPRLLKSNRHDPRFYERLWESVLAGEAFRAVFLNRAKDGREYYADIAITPLRDGQGTITHFVSTVRDITEHVRHDEAARRLNERLEHEAGRIAGLLHDEAGQMLTTAHITLSELARELPPSAQDRIRDVRQNLNEVEEQLRHLSHELRPRILDDMGLVDALKFLAEGVTRRTGVLIEVEATLEAPCTALVETTVYRLAQEGLTNITKHAKATRGRISIRQEGRQLLCSVQDNGRGFAATAAPDRRAARGVGLLGIRDRLEVLDGRLEILSRPGEGTELRASIPLEHIDAIASSARG